MTDETGAADVDRPRRGSGGAGDAATWPWVRLLRPRQWIKNGLVLAAPAAAGVLDEGEYLGRALVIAVAFCLAAWHLLPQRRLGRGGRPGSSHQTAPARGGRGDQSHPACQVGVLLLIVAIAVGALTGSWEASAITAIYIALTTSYTVWFKHLPVLDIALVTSFFVIRAVAGVVGTDIPLSDWYLIVASFGALFLVAGKRSTELRMDDAAGHRAALAGYTAGFLRYVQSLASGVALLAYCLWAFEKADLSDSSVPWFQLSIVPFVVVFLRYALILETEDRRGPEEILLEDRQLQVLGLVWALVFGCGVYLGHAPPLTS